MLQSFFAVRSVKSFALRSITKISSYFLEINSIPVCNIPNMIVPLIVIYWSIAYFVIVKFTAMNSHGFKLLCSSQIDY